MIIDCISDLHGHKPILQGGDLLIIAGDLTARDTHLQMMEFNSWVASLPYRKVVYVAGNHDMRLKKDPNNHICQFPWVQYLEDATIEWEGLIIHGSPWTKYFAGMNPDCSAFTMHYEDHLEHQWAKIPNDCNILLTHSPPAGFLDKVSDHDCHVGSTTLTKRVSEVCPALHVFGHIHEGYGEQNYDLTHFVNASQMNIDYKPVNKPIRINYDTKLKKVIWKETKNLYGSDKLLASKE